MFKFVSADEAEKVGIEEATLREALRTPPEQCTAEQQALRKVWRRQQRAKAAAWYAERGVAPVDLLKALDR